MALVNKNILLRAVEPEDLEWFYRWENTPEIWSVSQTIRPFSRYMLKQYIETAHQDIYQNRQVRFMVDLLTDSQVTIGTIDLFDFDPFHMRAGIGILIADQKHRGKGYAGLALEKLINHAFRQIGLVQLYCNILRTNTQSLHLFQKAGFEIVGLKKKWIRLGNTWEDEYLLQLLNE